MRAVFLDRDGVINELVYHQELGGIDSPFTPEQFRLLPGVGRAIQRLRQKGYKVVLASNQPSLARGRITEETFARIRKRMADALAKDGAFLDGEYYCFHHPEAEIEKFRAKCQCHKPEPGMLQQAARDMGIDLFRSWMIGDNLSDVKAGKNAGTGTILLGNNQNEQQQLMAEKDDRPDAVAADLSEAVQFILNKG